MTALLLDTHALAWAVGDPAKLSGSAREAIEDATNQLVVSAVTPWELATKYRAGRWPGVESLVGGFDAEVQVLRADLLDITARHALRAGGLSWDHGDPFDRMLAAQAMTEHLRLVSADPVFRDLPGLDLLW